MRHIFLRHMRLILLLTIHSHACESPRMTAGAPPLPYNSRQQRLARDAPSPRRLRFGSAERRNKPLHRPTGAGEVLPPRSPLASRTTGSRPGLGGGLGPYAASWLHLTRAARPGARRCRPRSRTVLLPCRARVSCRLGRGDEGAAEVQWGEWDSRGVASSERRRERGRVRSGRSLDLSTVCRDLR